ncbi:hypothetical protein [Leptospira kanakyensis]|uniref:Lipoprotein n=1 Tax=Leptospira kanakyensis TaxID=2484968 RepID=A0A6N4Q2M7_9LEPT|nr:hypothetical protein [Leptospira kanakyensis]MCW7471566.1 hypothetical protein [Leptospira kanakyensis]MCW7481218.1 hypothetical protein [Leptospira kanakyensis]TGK46145.1 hypothetical protein EHQ11_19570 [Leptospira kanakyensis]TGK65083.1 hypothetical protein EHQ16_00580 [Leptospira kanakyensis]TGK65514.1 hypothetical protein EHQ18_19790 [Leptospira kanakyensis]
MKASNKKILAVALMLFLASFVTNCVTVQGNYAFVSEKEIDFNKEYEKKPQPIKAEYSVPFVLLPLGDTRVSRMSAEVIQKACAENGVEFLTNTQINSSSFYFFLYGQVKYELTGDGWIEKQTPAKKGK